MRQPRINWWRGNLRPYESADSFLARFCELNRLPLSEARTYFREIFEPGRQPSIEDIEWLAEELNEPLDVVQTVVSPALNVRSFGACQPRTSKREASLRFCPSCMAVGYHSNLHEELWLERCIFHGDILRSASDQRGNGTIISRRQRLIKDVMANHSRPWPRALAFPVELEQSATFQLFFDWIRATRAIVGGISNSTIWRLDQETFSGEPTLEHLIGQFHALNPIPTGIRSYFVDFEDNWAADLHRFPVHLKSEVTRVSGSLNFSRIYELFKQICMQAPLWRPFRKMHAETLKILEARHRDCACAWGLASGSPRFWQQVDPQGWPHWCFECPYEVAKRDLEIALGSGFELMSRRDAEHSKMQLFRLARELKDLGFIGFTPDANISEDGYAYIYPQVWPCFEWAAGEQLTRLLETIAESEVLARSDSTIRWLNSIEGGSHPYRAHSARTDISLHVSEEALTLIRWHRPVHSARN